MAIKKYSKPKTPEPAPVFEVTMPAPDMEGVVDVIRQVIDRPIAVPEINVAAPEVIVNVPEPKRRLKKWDIKFERNNMGITGAILTELPYDDR